MKLKKDEISQRGYIPLRGSKASKKGDILEGFYIGVDHGHDHEAVIRKELFHG